MIALESREYGEARAVLVAETIVQDMHMGLLMGGTTVEELTHGDGTPQMTFMMAANNEYTKRGGTNLAHIGAVAEALLILMQDGS